MNVFVWFVLGLPAGLLLGWFIGWFGVPVKRPAARRARVPAIGAGAPVIPSPSATVTPPSPPAPAPAADPAPPERLWGRPTTTDAEVSKGIEAAVANEDVAPPSDAGADPTPQTGYAPSVSAGTSPLPRGSEDGRSAPDSDEPPADEAIASILGASGALDIERVEGVGRVYAGRLRDAGITSVAALFAAASTDYRRRRLADELRISRKLILRWVNHADLMRLDGVDAQFAELLEAAGVDSPTELRHRVPAHLTARMAEVDAEKHIAPEVPDEATVAAWIEAAKALPKIVSH